MEQATTVDVRIRGLHRNIAVLANQFHIVPDEYGNLIRSPKIIGRYIDDKAVVPHDWAEVVKEIEAANHPRQPVTSWEELMELGEQSLPEMEELLSSLGFPIIPLEDMESQIDQPGGISVLAPLKGQRRALEKTEGDYNGDWSQLLDVLRASVAVDSMDELYQLVEDLDWDIVRSKDRFQEPLPAGYRDYLINTRLPSGMIAEVQFHVKPTIKAREQVKRSHWQTIRDVSNAMREEGRDSMTMEEAAAVQQAMAISKQIFDQAWQEAAGINPSPSDPAKKSFPRLYFTKANDDQPFTGEFRDSLGRRVCIANGRRIACGERGFVDKPEASAREDKPAGSTIQPEQPSARTHEQPTKIDPEAGKSQKLLFAVIFNSDGKMLVRDNDPWGGFVWSAQKKDFVTTLEKMTGLSLKNIGMVGNPEQGQGYFILRAEGHKQPEQKSYPVKAEPEGGSEPPKAPEPEKPKEESPKPPEQSKPPEKPKQRTINLEDLGLTDDPSMPPAIFNAEGGFIDPSVTPETRAQDWTQEQMRYNLAPSASSIQHLGEYMDSYIAGIVRDAEEAGFSPEQIEYIRNNARQWMTDYWLQQAWQRYEDATGTPSDERATREVEPFAWEEGPSWEIETGRPLPAGIDPDDEIPIDTFLRDFRDRDIDDPLISQFTGRGLSTFGIAQNIAEMYGRQAEAVGLPNEDVNRLVHYIYRAALRLVREHTPIEMIEEEDAQLAAEEVPGQGAASNDWGLDYIDPLVQEFRRRGMRDPEFARIVAQSHTPEDVAHGIASLYGFHAGEAGFSEIAKYRLIRSIYQEVMRQFRDENE